MYVENEMKKKMDTKNKRNKTRTGRNRKEKKDDQKSKYYDILQLFAS